MATDVSAPLPLTILAPGSTLTVTLSDTSGKITLLNVYGANSLPEPDTKPPAYSPTFTYVQG